MTELNPVSIENGTVKEANLIYRIPLPLFLLVKEWSR